MKELWPVVITCVLMLMGCRHHPVKAIQNDWADYRKAYSFLSKNKDSAFYYFNKVAANVKDSVQVSMACYSIATLQQDAGDNFGSQESLSTSLKFLNERYPANYKAIAADYNELGLTSYNLKNYNEAIEFYHQAIRFSNDPDVAQYILNNLAKAYQKKRDYQQALLLYQKVLSTKILSPHTYARTLTNIVIVRNDELFWKKTDAGVKYELEHILQEIMVNMKKHSRADNVVVKFLAQGKHLHICYADDGIGFAAGIAHKTGLTNTGNRIKTIGGDIIFESNTGEGISITITFPIA